MDATSTYIVTNMNMPVSANLCASDNNTQPTTTVDFKLSTKALRNMYGATTTDVLPFIEKHMLTYEINTKQRMSAFLSACFIMSSGFRRRAENYSFTACRLVKECEKVDSIALAKRLIRNGEEEIANYLFAFENGNGGIDSNDGWMFRARSPLQFRGRNIYELVHRIAGIDCLNNPQLLDEDENYIIAAMVYWQSQGYNEMCDKLKFSNGFELEVKQHKNQNTKNYRTNNMAVTMKKKLTKNTTGLMDFCTFIESGMLYL